MVSHTSDHNRLESLALGDSSHIRPESGLEIVGNRVGSLFRAEDHVHAVAAVVCDIVSSRRDSVRFLSTSPALKRWAKLFWPLRA